MLSRHPSPTSGLIPFFSASPNTKLRGANRGWPDPCANITDLRAGHREPPENSESFPLSCIEVRINPKGTVPEVRAHRNSADRGFHEPLPPDPRRVIM
jgi:hypothetical protein